MRDVTYLHPIWKEISREKKVGEAASPLFLAKSLDFPLSSFLGLQFANQIAACLLLAHQKSKEGR